MQRRVNFGSGCIFLLASLLSTSPAAHAQFTADFQTNTISGVTSNWVGQPFYVVGSNTFADVLQIINAGVLSNGSCVIGYALAGSNNTAVISGTGSMLTNRFDIYVGNNGANSSLVISNAGKVFSGNGYMGFYAGASNGMARVSDAGSVWRSRTNLLVGYVESGNQLIVSNSGVVSDLIGMIGSNGNHNAALVTGGGSVWSNGVSLSVGYVGSDNQLTVTNNGLVWDSFSYIGAANVSSNNVATVVGTGSTWRNTNTLYVGFFGSSNKLAVLNGGVANSVSSYIGEDAMASNNTALVAGSGAMLSNSINLFVGYGGVGNQLIVTNAGKALNLAGTIGYTNSATGNRALIEGSGSIWSNKVYLYVGYVGSDNQLIVSNGATVFSGTGFVGSDRLASNNTATVVGNGSIWANTNYLYVGYIGSSNTLVVADGGRASAPETRIGFDPVSTNNLALVTGTGALLSNSANTIVGYGGFAGQLIISNGATVLDQVGAVGYTNQSSANLAVVTGGAWSNTTATYVGYKSAGNQLVVADGGVLFDADAHIGTFAPSSNNAVMVTGPGSRWRNTGYLHVGELGSSNTLTVADGGTAVAGLETRVGWDTFSSNNVLTVTGTGALLSNTVNTLVGVAGPLNRLVLANNALIQNQAGIVGYSNSANRTVAIVDGGVWSNTVNFQVGYKASLNQLIVTNGGKIYSPDSFIGTFNVGNSNTAVVTGPGSRWASTNNLYVGQDGRSNSLVIANGGGVSDVNGFIGYNATAGTNAALVTGPGASWTNTTLFYVGTFAAGNALTVSNGGTVYTAGDTILGYGATGDRNSVLITGTNSTWVNNRVYVGLDGASNSVTIANGANGTILDGYNSTLYLGYNSGSISNTVLVTGPGSYWLVANLYVGYASRSNSLTIANGGSLESLQSFVGYTTGSNNFALVTGPGSKWQNDQYLYVGNGGSRNSLVVSNGGIVSTVFSSYVGSNGGVSNSALVADAGSVWTNVYNLYVGYSSRANSLIVSNGGAVHGGYNGSAVGYASSTGVNGSNNFAVITGGNSVWNNSGSFAVGDGAHSNRLTVASAGKIAASSIFVGARGGTNNLLRLTEGFAQAGAVNVGTGNFLTGSGTVTGSLLNNGTVNADINGATLTFNNLVKNNGTLRASGGGIIEFYGPVLNFGTTNFTGGTAIFHAGIFSSTGTTNSWIFAGNGPWHTAARWSLGVTPSPADSLVLITNATTKTITVNAVTFTNAPDSVNNFSIVLSAPTGDTNTLRIINSPAGTNFTSISMAVGTNANLTIDNATVQVGAFGTGDFTVDGELRIETGGNLDTTGVGTSTVAKATINGGSWSNSVLKATVFGQLIVTNGGLLFSSGDTVLDSNCVGSVTGSNSMLNMAGSLAIGNTGNNNQFTIDGTNATVNAANVSIGNGASNQITVINGGGLSTTSGGFVGAGGSNNVMTISGGGSSWTNNSQLIVGYFGPGNQLVITNGGKLVNYGFVTFIGANAGASNNTITVTGTNSSWSEIGSFICYVGSSAGGNRLIVADGGSVSNLASGFVIGSSSTDNQLIVTNGGTLVSYACSIGGSDAGSNNLATVAGTNSLWQAISTLTIGSSANSNRLEIAGGTVVALNGLYVGRPGTNNLVRLTDGALFVTNTLVGGSPLVVSASGGPGSLILDGGTVTVDKLILTNGPNSVLAFNAGTIHSKSAFVTNAQQFVVGNGTSSATYHLLGGTHNFTTGLRVRSNAFLTGCGTVNAVTVIDPGGTVVADCSPLVFTGSVTNNGTLRLINGNTLQTHGTLVNNGTIDLINGGVTNFLGAFVNTGVILDSNSVVIAQSTAAGNDFVVTIQSVTGHSYQLQVRDSLETGAWSDILSAQSGNDGVLMFVDPGGATNYPTRIYRVRVSPQ